MKILDINKLNVVDIYINILSIKKYVCKNYDISDNEFEIYVKINQIVFLHNKVSKYEFTFNDVIEHKKKLDKRYYSINIEKIKVFLKYYRLFEL